MKLVPLLLPSSFAAAMPSEVSENETVCIQWIVLPDKTLYTFPVREINHLSVIPNDE